MLVSPDAFGVGDPDFASVQLLVQPQGPDGSTTFDDQSLANRTITVVGTAQQDTAITQWSPASVLVNGVSGIYVADAAALRPGTGNFTLEFSFRYSNLAGFQTLVDKGYTGSGGMLLQTGNSDGKPIVYLNGASVLTDTGAAISTGVWYDWFFVRNGTALSLYRNGVLVGSATNSTNLNSTDPLAFYHRQSTGITGSIGSGGYIRYTPGVARTMAVPTGQFPTF